MFLGFHVRKPPGTQILVFFALEKMFLVFLCLFGVHTYFFVPIFYMHRNDFVVCLKVRFQLILTKTRDFNSFSNFWWMQKCSFSSKNAPKCQKMLEKADFGQKSSKISKFQKSPFANEFLWNIAESKICGTSNTMF